VITLKIQIDDLAFLLDDGEGDTPVARDRQALSTALISGQSMYVPKRHRLQLVDTSHVLQKRDDASHFLDEGRRQSSSVIAFDEAPQSTMTDIANPQDDS
jgi:hypothetical protein